ncbi:MAG: hypothetical protein HY700_17170 [Gemmatimonadetes bacterium]|nr:hypothetical protein [Gemmatimonadota bacterium]
MACFPDKQPTAIDAADLRAAVTGAAASALAISGARFEAIPANKVSPSEISEAAARELAVTFVRQAGPLLRSGLERDHGGPIDISTLSPCGPAYYAETPNHVVIEDNDEGANSIAYTAFGSWWIFGFCGPQGDLQVSEAVAAMTRAKIVSGHLEGLNGMDQFMKGIPAEWDSPVGFSAERAVLRIARRTGRRIAAVPRLVRRSGFIPQNAIWQLRTEGPVQMTLRGTGSQTASAQLYAWLTRDIADTVVWLPAAGEPREFQMPVPVQSDGTVVPKTATISVRDGFATRFDAADPERGTNEPAP